MIKNRGIIYFTIYWLTWGSIMKNLRKNLFLNIIFIAVIFAGVMCFPEFTMVFQVLSGIAFMTFAFSDNYLKTSILSALFLVVSLSAALAKGINYETICYGFSTFFLMVLPGCVMGIMAKKGRSFSSVLCGGALSYMLGLLTDLFRLNIILGINLTEEFINKPIAQFFASYKTAMDSIGTAEIQKISQALGDIQWYMQQAIGMIMPSFLILACAFMAYVIFVSSRKIIEKNQDEKMPYPTFHSLQMPKSTSLMLCALYILSLFLKSSPFSGAISNIIIILSSIYMVCGLSLADWYLKKAGIKRFLRIFIYFALFLFTSFLGIIFPAVNIFSILIFAGVIDSMTDFRRLRWEATDDEK